MLPGAAPSIWYGPFPIRLGRILGGFGALFVAVLLLFVGLETQELRCNFRDGGVCELETRFSTTPDARFYSSELTAARVDIVHRGKGKGTPYGKVVLGVGGRELSLMEIDPDEAQALVQRLELAQAGRTELKATLDGSRWLLVFSAGSLAMACSFLWVALRRAGRLRLTFPGDGTLRVKRFFLGIPLATRSLPFVGVREISVDFGTESDPWNRRGEVPRRTGRLLLHGNNGIVPLTPEHWPGITLHLRAATELRRLLGLSPGRLEQELVAAEGSRVAPGFAKSAGGRFALVWIGLCCGSVLGLAVFGGLGLALGQLRLSDGIEAWMLLVGSGGGAIAGVLIALAAARPQPPR